MRPSAQGVRVILDQGVDPPFGEFGHEKAIHRRERKERRDFDRINRNRYF